MTDWRPEPGERVRAKLTALHRKADGSIGRIEKGACGAVGYTRDGPDSYGGWDALVRWDDGTEGGAVAVNLEPEAPAGAIE